MRRDYLDLKSKLDQALHWINYLLQAASSSHNHSIKMDRPHSNIIGSSKTPCNFQESYLIPFDNPSSKMIPSFSLLDSSSHSNNIVSNIINSKAENNILSGKLLYQHQLSPNLQALKDFQQLKNHSSQADELREEKSSVSTSKETPINTNTDHSHYNNSSSNTECVIHGWGCKSKNSQKEIIKNMTCLNSKAAPHELESTHTLPPISLINNEGSTKLSIHNNGSKVEISDRNAQGKSENIKADMCFFDNTLTSKNHDSLRYVCAPSFKKEDSTPFIKTNVTEQLENDPITIIGLFSEPLVSIPKEARNSKKPEQYSPVDFEDEISKIAEVIQNQDKEKISFRVGLLNVENFRKIIESPPEIIHIMCHGDFEEESKRYYLDFENENAEVFPFFNDNIEKFLDATNLESAIFVLLNACYSEQIADLFLKRNVKCVVAIDKFSKIDDRVSKDFARVFYSHLLSNATLQRAFDNTVTDLSITYSRNQESYFTFCAHTHKKDCKWNNNDHAYLVKKMRTCECPNKFRNVHQKNCIIVLNYQTNIWIDTNNEGLNLNGDELLLCCCSPEIPHEEIHKFKIFFSDDRFKQMTLSSIKLTTQNGSKKTQFKGFDDPFIQKKFANVSSVGFKVHIYHLFNYFTKPAGRIGVVSGENGSGKTTLVKHFANYCFHRNKFKFIFYENFAQIHVIEELVSTIHQKLNGDSEKGQTRIKTKSLFILDNLDVLINKNFERVEQEIEFFIQNEDLYFLITLNNSNDTNFPLENIGISLMPLSYYYGGQLFLSKCQLSLPSTYQDFKSLLEYKDFQDIQKLMKFSPFNLISLANSIHTVTFNFEGMKSLIDKINKRYELQETLELMTPQNIGIENDLFEYNFFIFLGLLEQGVYFLEDLVSYAFQNTLCEARSLIKFILDEVIESQKLSQSSMKEYTRIESLMYTDHNHTRDRYLNVFECLRDLIIESRLKSSHSIEIGTLNIDLLTDRENESLLLLKTSKVRKHLKNNFTPRVCDQLLSVFNFLIMKANCFISYFQSNYMVVEDTYFTAFWQFEFIPFSMDVRFKKSKCRKGKLDKFIKSHLMNIKSIIEDNTLISCYFSFVQQNEASATNSLWIFKQLIVKFFSIVEMDLINKSYFDIKIEFKNLVSIILMDDRLSNSLNELYLQLCLFSLNSMLKKQFLQKYRHNSSDLIKDRISLIKWIFKKPHVKNNEKLFNIYKLEFYYLQIRADKKLSKAKEPDQVSKPFRFDKKSLELLAKLETAVQSLECSFHTHFLCKVYFMLVKHKYESNNLDLTYVFDLEYYFETLTETSNINLSLRTHLAFCAIYNDWNNQVLRDLHLRKAQDINEKAHKNYEKRVSRIVSALNNKNLIAKSQFAFAVASYYRHTEFDFSQIQIMGLDTFKKLFVNIMEDHPNCHANFMCEPLNRSTLRRLLQVQMHYKVLCLYFNSIHRSAFYFDTNTETLEYDAFSPKEFLSLLKERKAQIEILVLLNPIADREVLNQICLEIPYTIYIKKFELASIATPDAEKKIVNFCVLNLLKQFVSRLIYEGQHNVLEVFQSSVEVVYNCLEAFISQYIVSSEEKQPSESEAEQSFEESLANVVKSNLKFKLLWNNETPFFEKLFEAIDQTSCVISINSSDDFGTIFRLNDQKHYPMTEEAPLQKRLYKNCEGFTSSSQLIEWLFKTLDMYNRQRKKSRGKKAKKNNLFEIPIITPNTLILYGVHFEIDQLIDENLAKLIIRLKITIMIFNSPEHSFEYPYMINIRKILLPKQDFNFMIFNYSTKENLKLSEIKMQELIKFVTKSVFLSSDEDNYFFSESPIRRIGLEMPIILQNPDNSETA